MNFKNLTKKFKKLTNRFYLINLYFELISQINRKDYILVLFLNLFSNLLDLLNIGLFISIIFNNSFLNFSTYSDQLTNQYKIFVLLIFLLARSFVKIKAAIFLKNISLRFSDQMKEKIFKKIIYAKNEELDKFGKNELFNILNIEIIRTVNAINQGSIFINSIFSFSIYLLGILTFSRNSLLIIIGVIFSILIASILQKYGALEIGILQSKLLLNLQKILGDSLNGLKSIQANNAGGWLLNKLKEENINNRNFSLGIFKRQLFYRFYGEFSILLLFSFWLSQNIRSYSLSFIVTNILLLVRLSNSFTNIIDSKRNTITSLAAFIKLKKLNNLIKSKKIFVNKKELVIINKESREIIEFNWKYTYKNKIKYDLILKKSSICVLKGESGIGKTTFLDLFSGLLNPNNSRWQIKLDKEINKSFIGEEGASLIKNFLTYCTQESFFFEGSLKDNLIFSRPLNTSDNLKIDNIIKDLLVELDLKNILDRDYSLKKPINLAMDFYSGGEKKRLGLIRTFLKDKAIEIYDEPTSYLDEEGGKKVINLLKERSKEKIIIISTHDEKIIDIADQVININDYKDLIDSVRRV